MRLKLLIIFSILIASTKTYAQQKPLLTKTEGLIYCLDSAEFKISNLYYGQSKKDVLRILGIPNSVWVEKVVSESNYYKGLRVDYNKSGNVYCIFTSSEKLKTPSGMHT